MVNTQFGLGEVPYILSVGVLQPRKNLGVLLDAFGLLKLGPDPPPQPRGLPRGRVLPHPAERVTGRGHPVFSS